MKNFFKWLDNDSPDWVKILAGINFILLGFLLVAAILILSNPLWLFVSFLVLSPILVGIAYYRHKTKK